jgi:hypothetical protein
VDERLVMRDEPLSRGRGSKPHRAEFCYQVNGEAVWVCSRYPSGVPKAVYRRILRAHPEAKSWGWGRMVRDAKVYVRGRIRHSDHRTVVLQGWHRVLMNTENMAVAMRHVAFLD